MSLIEEMFTVSQPQTKCELFTGCPVSQLGHIRVNRLSGNFFFFKKT